MLSDEQKAKLHAMRIAMDGGVTLAAAQGTAAINSVTALVRMWKPGTYVIGDVRAEGGVPYQGVGCARGGARYVQAGRMDDLHGWKHL